VEHRFRQPLVGVILQQRVEERDGAVQRNDRTAGVARLEQADERGRIRVGGGHTVGTGERAAASCTRAVGSVRDSGEPWLTQACGMRR
jgi:hypothetical protein